MRKYFACFLLLFTTLLFFSFNKLESSPTKVDEYISSQKDFFNAIVEKSKTSLKKVKVVLDPGHGGKDPGKLRGSKTYKHEKDLNLLIAKKVGNYLKTKTSNIEVIYTRTTDVFVSLEDRVNLANNRKADYFVSIHCNSNPNRLVRGSKMHIHSRKFKTSLAYSKHFEKEFRTRAGRYSRGIMDARQRGYNLYVLQYTNMPGVLLEVGFMSNKTEERYLNSNYGQEIIASAIFRTIRDFAAKQHAREKRSTIYKVQIMASDKKVPLNHPSFKKLGLQVVELKVKRGKGYVYKYVVGREYERVLAEKVLREVRKKGYKDAFIIAIPNPQY